MSFSHNLGDILFDRGWSLGGLAQYTGPETESRLVRDTGYDDTDRRQETCLECLREASVISNKEYVDAIEQSMMPGFDYADPRIQPAPQIEAILPNGKTVTLGEESEPKKPRI